MPLSVLWMPSFVTGLALFAMWMLSSMGCAVCLGRTLGEDEQSGMCKDGWEGVSGGWAGLG